MALIQTEWWGRGPFSYSHEKETFALKVGRQWVEKIFLIYLHYLCWLFGCVDVHIWVSNYVVVDTSSLALKWGVCERENIWSSWKQINVIIKLIFYIKWDMRYEHNLHFNDEKSISSDLREYEHLNSSRRRLKFSLITSGFVKCGIKVA